MRAHATPRKEGAGFCPALQASPRQGKANDRPSQRTQRPRAGPQAPHPGPQAPHPTPTRGEWNMLARRSEEEEGRQDWAGRHDLAL